VETQTRHKHWTASFVVDGIIDVLQIARREKSAPQVRGVESFQDFFRAVGESAVAQQKTQCPESQILLVRRYDSVGDERHSGAIVAAAPPISFGKRALSDESVSVVVAVCARTEESSGR
jgi:hypothetical protein